MVRHGVDPEPGQWIAAGDRAAVPETATQPAGTINKTDPSHSSPRDRRRIRIPVLWSRVFTSGPRYNPVSGPQLRMDQLRLALAELLGEALATIYAGLVARA
jgi:hypothetical protein